MARPNPQSATQDQPRRVFAAFSGGGAKGLVHIGALKILEEERVVFAGLSGTSAGAIVAALKAAGFTADDMVDPASGRTLVDEIREFAPGISRITDLFGKGGWRRIRLMRDHGKRRAIAGVLFLAVLLVVLGALLAIGFIAGAALLVAILGLGVYLARRFVLAGLANLATFRDLLATLLQRRMFPGEPGRVVKMSDFAHDTDRPALKIVGTNITRRRLELFSPERTPDVPVADAVAASICLPGIFTVWPIDRDGERELFFDGGVVSNLPAWPFDEERELDPDALTLAIDILDQPAAAKPGPLNWLFPLVRTALFGAAELNLRQAGTSELIELEAETGILDFDISHDLVLKQVENATNAARARIRTRVFQVAEVYREACDTTRILAETVLDTMAPHLLDGACRGFVRVGLMWPDTGNIRSLRQHFSSGFATMPDEGLLLPIDGSLAGRAWRRRQEDHQFETVPFPSGADLQAPSFRRLRNRIWPDLKWSLCVPIFEADAAADDNPAFVVSLDGNDPLDADDDTTEAVIDYLAEQIRTAFADTLVRLAQLRGEIPLAPTPQRQAAGAEA